MRQTFFPSLNAKSIHPSINNIIINIISALRRQFDWQPSPVLSLVPLAHATIAPMLGWDVIPAMESTATSTMSAPASAHASMAATPAPAVSWVCTWIGTSGKRSLRAPTSKRPESGFRRPAMSCNVDSQRDKVKESKRNALETNRDSDAVVFYVWVEAEWEQQSVWKSEQELRLTKQTNG